MSAMATLTPAEVNGAAESYRRACRRACDAAKAAASACCERPRSEPAREAARQASADCGRARAVLVERDAEMARLCGDIEAQVEAERTHGCRSAQAKTAKQAAKATQKRLVARAAKATREAM